MAKWRAIVDAITTKLQASKQTFIVNFRFAPA